jgi:twitching motility two-component system response regulator PilH
LAGFYGRQFETEVNEIVPVPNKILIVDDSQAESRLMQSYLEPAGYWVVLLADPALIEQTLDIERPSMILLDVVMPGRNGFQACRELKAQPNYGSIPIVLVTSKGTQSDQFWGRTQGADGYVVKPFTREQLVGEISRVLGRSQPVAQGAAPTP